MKKAPVFKRIRDKFIEIRDKIKENPQFKALVAKGLELKDKLAKKAKELVAKAKAKGDYSCVSASRRIALQNEGQNSD